jgi:hypothetical protein
VCFQKNVSCAVATEYTCPCDQRAGVTVTAERLQRWVHKFEGLHNNRCRARAQAFSRRLPTTAARVRARVRSCGIFVRQGGIGAGFLPLLRLPLLILIPLLHSHRYLSSGTGIIGQLIADVPSGLSLIPPQGGGGTKPHEDRRHLYMYFF